MFTFSFSSDPSSTAGQRHQLQFSAPGAAWIGANPLPLRRSVSSVASSVALLTPWMNLGCVRMPDFPPCRIASWARLFVHSAVAAFVACRGARVHYRLNEFREDHSTSGRRFGVGNDAGANLRDVVANATLQQPGDDCFADAAAPLNQFGPTSPFSLRWVGVSIAILIRCRTNHADF
jgi:hypothetical protein